MNRATLLGVVVAVGVLSMAAAGSQAPPPARPTPAADSHTEPEGQESFFFGATVDSVVQENTKANMVKMPTFGGHTAQVLPRRTFKDKMTLMNGKDLFAWKDLPVADLNNGGSVVGYPDTLSNSGLGTKRDEGWQVRGHAEPRAMHLKANTQSAYDGE